MYRIFEELVVPANESNPGEQYFPCISAVRFLYLSPISCPEVIDDNCMS
jgi:hypothetical protein